MDFTPSPKSLEYIQRVQRFIRERIAPVEHRYWDEVAARNPTGDWRTWTIHPLVEELKAEARKLGLWNLFLPDPSLGAGLSVLDYAPVAEDMGRSFLAPEVFNCSAPTPATWRCCGATGPTRSSGAGSIRCSPARSARRSA